MRHLASVILAVAAILVLAASSVPHVGPRVVSAQESWVIRDFHAVIDVEPSGSLRIVETLQVDFGTERRRGIFREIPVRYSYDRDHDRHYVLSVLAVHDGRGQPWPYVVESAGEANQRIRIGDPDRQITGLQTYAIDYRVDGVLNAFADHDELYWNVTGAEWPVPIQRARAEVRLPRDAVQRIACYEGPTGSADPCRSSDTRRTGTFEATGPLDPGSELTIVVGFDRGVVPDPQPLLTPREPDFLDFFEPSPLALAGMVPTAGLMLLWLVSSWWRNGRDRRYQTLYYLTDDPSQETRPPLARDAIVVEYIPPEKIRPAHAGVLLDESADPLDATATIVDLAVRGHLTIEPQTSTTLGIFTSRDWLLTRREADESELLPYERELLKGVFGGSDSVKLSDRKNKLYTHLGRAQELLYADVTKRHWFADDPSHTRRRWRWIGAGVAVLGSVLAGGLGLFGLGLIAVPVILGGVLMVLVAGSMPRRTAGGSEMLRRVLGFRLYLATAETSRQRFNEQQNIFADYLPYAIVFGCVDKWAHAFRDVYTQTAVATWYVGVDGRGFSAEAFSRDVNSFASSVTSTITSTPGSSGSSGFGGGGSSGGGGGGGGGGSW